MFLLIDDDQLSKNLIINKYVLLTEISNKNSERYCGLRKVIES